MLYIPYPFRCCTKCGNEYLPNLKYFRRDKRRLRTRCRACDDLYHAIYRSTHREQANAYAALYRSTHQQEITAYRRIHSKEHAAYCVIYEAEHHDEIYKRRANRSQIYLLRQHRRKARKLSLPVSFTSVDWQHALDYFGNCCAVCGRPQGLWHTIAADHWIPLTDPSCPGTIPGNIVPLCHGIDGCNNSKSNRDPVEWLIWKFGKRKATKILARIEAYFKT